MGNPLGSHSGVHKIGCVYYTVPAIPPEYLSSLENIFIAYLFHSEDRGIQKVNNHIMFNALIKELIDLHENGISVTVNLNTYQIYFALGLVLGDNLGLNSILGFTESFSANHYCRIFRAHKSELRKMIFESNESLRNPANYQVDVSLANYSETGIKECCIFNQIPSYHVVVNYICDFMHDVVEGVARYDMALIIKKLIDSKYITLEVLNTRIELFNYGTNEKRNTPPKINLNNLINGNVIMSASEMLCLLRYFALIIGDLVPRDTEVWRLYILLRKIVDLYCARQIQPECSVLLNSLVAEHNSLYLIIFKSHLKPKYHFMTHYGQLLLKNGPIILTSSIRFEEKHKVLKAYANSIACRINLGHTLSYKLQLQMTSRFLTCRGLKPDLKLPNKSCSDINSIYTVFQFVNLPVELKCNSSWLKYKGLFYKTGMVVVLKVNLEMYLFGEICGMIIGKSRIPYFIIKPMCTIGFDTHFYAFEIEKNSSSSSELTGCYITNLPDPTPTITRVLANGKIYVALKYAL